MSPFYKKPITDANIFRGINPIIVVVIVFIITYNIVSKMRFVFMSISDLIQLISIVVSTLTSIIGIILSVKTIRQTDVILKS